MKGGSKYQPLHDYLSHSGRSPITLTFAELEAILGTPLPASAYTNRAWWSNRSKGALQAIAWMQAGYTVKTIDLAAAQVTFQKPPAVYKVQTVDDVVQWDGELVRALRQHLGITQTELAAELGVRQQTVSEWEQGVYTPTRASAKQLMRVAEQAQFRYSPSGSGDRPG